MLERPSEVSDSAVGSVTIRPRRQVFDPEAMAVHCAVCDDDSFDEADTSTYLADSPNQRRRAHAPDADDISASKSRSSHGDACSRRDPGFDRDGRLDRSTWIN